MPSYTFDHTIYIDQILAIFHELDQIQDLDESSYRKIIHKYPKSHGNFFTKNNLVLTYKALKETGHPELPKSPDLLSKIQMKPTRTISGVTPVTVLTKPFPCPGECIFCPNDIRMPKSYLSDEPGAQRAERNAFDPYLQTFSRLKALSDIGHEVNKVELIVLGGTWSFYPERYQIWFIKRCFQAMNDFGEENFDEYENLKTKGIENHRQLQKNTEVIRNASKSNETYNTIIAHKVKNDPTEKSTWEELFLEHKRNETNNCRCVGLVVETRPDKIDEQEVIRIRKLGCTKTQIGFQSLQDEVLEKNHRGHDVAATIEAVRLLRLAGFKIHAHWMANLYGSNPENDIQDYEKMFSDKNFRPDEIKLYPCSLIETAELMDYYNQGLWKPYSHEQLLEVVSQAIARTPAYCRLTRIIRDIPSTDIVTGNKFTNFRQLAEQDLDKRGIAKMDIRSREIKNRHLTQEDLQLEILKYETQTGEEQFLQFVTEDYKIAGFLRLALPGKSPDLEVVNSFGHPFIPELHNSAIIREIHIYGQTVAVGKTLEGKAQHLGLGKQLIEKATEIAKQAGYEKLAVISGIGTREYYRKRGFQDGELYQFLELG